MGLFNKLRKKKNLEEKVDWETVMKGNNSNIDRLNHVATQVNIDPVTREVIDETEKADKIVADTFKEISKSAKGITPEDPGTGKKISIKPYTEKLTLDESLFEEDYYTKDESMNKKENKKSKHLCEAYDDGWDIEKLGELQEILNRLSNLNYEIQSCVRGAYSNCKDYSSLGQYVSDLGDSLSMIGEEVAELDDEDFEESLDVKKNKLNEYVAEDEVVEDEYTVFDLLNDRLFGYGFKKSNFRGKWKFAEVEPTIKTKEGKIKRSYFYPTAHSDDLITGNDVDRRAFIDNGIGVFLYDESEAGLAKKCAEELNLDFEIKKLLKPTKGFNYMAIIKVPDEIAEMPVVDYVEAIGKSMKDFLRSKNDKGSRSDFGGHKNYEFRKNK